jgi:hypothetical protein
LCRSVVGPLCRFRAAASSGWMGGNVKKIGQRVLMPLQIWGGIWRDVLFTVTCFEELGIQASSRVNCTISFTPCVGSKDEREETCEQETEAPGASFAFCRLGCYCGAWCTGAQPEILNSGADPESLGGLL